MHSSDYNHLVIMHRRFDHPADVGWGDEVGWVGLVWAVGTNDVDGSGVGVPMIWTSAGQPLRRARSSVGLSECESGIRADM